MLAFLKLIPTKDYLYGAAILTLLIGFGVYTHHERVVGEARIEAQDAKLAAAEKAKNEALESAAQAASNNIGVTYEKAVAIPPVADLGVVCHTTSRGQLPQTAQGGSGAAGTTPVIGGGATFDPSGAALTVGRDDDALILALQSQIRALLAEMTP